MTQLKPGDLVFTSEGYPSVVLAPVDARTITIFQGNGLTVDEHLDNLVGVPMAPDTEQVANFLELVQAYQARSPRP